MNLKIADADLLPDLFGSEKIPTGTRGNFATTPKQISNYTNLEIADSVLLPNLVGSEKIPTGTRGIASITPQQITDFTKDQVEADQLNSLVVVEDFLHSNLTKVTLTSLAVIDTSDAQMLQIQGSESWKGVKSLRYGTAATTANVMQTFGATTTAGANPSTMRWDEGDMFQLKSIFALPILSQVNNQYTFGIGFEHVQITNPQNTISLLGNSAAFLYTNTTTMTWHAYSGSNPNIQSTDTGVPVQALKSITIDVVIATDGVIRFYINNALVATHSGAGSLSSGAQLNPCLSWFNLSTQTLATESRNIYMDLFAYKMDFASRNLDWMKS